ncbi:MAG: ADOP family duplicated permease [Gemmatimonadota bacterium]
MNPLRDLFERCKALLFHARQEAELDEEMRDHVARETAARQRDGRAQASREAAIAFGGIERTKDEIRDASGVAPLREWFADVHYAIRALRRNAGFTLTVIGVLGAAIGAATVVFTVVQRVLIAGLPYPDPDRLVRVYQQNSATNRWSLSVVDLQAIAAQQRTLESFGAWQATTASLSGAGAPERVRVGRATSGFFATLQVATLRGRLLEPQDDSPSAAPVVVVSYRLAARLLGGPDQAIGRRVTIDGVTHAVVGVLPAGRDELGGITAEAWPILQLRTPLRRGPFGFGAIGRLKPGVTLEDARADLAGVSERLFPLWVAGFQDREARLTPYPLRDAVIGDAGGQVKLFAGAVALVLLLAIANVATLMLVRTASREHELSVRVALGAGRRRLIRLVLTECFVLVAAAGVLALVIAFVAIKGTALVAPTLPRLGELVVDGRSVAFALVLTFVAGALISLAPLSSRLVRGYGAASLAISPARTGPGRRAGIVRGVLVATEFALALPLVTGAGLLLTSFLRLQRVDPGFDPTGVYAVLIALPGGRYGDPATSQAFWRLAESRASELNGVTAAGLAGSIPPDNGGDVNNFDLLDRPVPTGTAQPVVPWSTVSAGYFAALGIPLLEGRLFTPGDSATAPPVVIVSRAWAAKYYPRSSAIGRQLYNGGCSTCPPTTVVGVVGDVPYLGLASATEGMYAPLAQDGPRTLNLVVRSRLDAGASFRALRAVVASLDPDLAPTEIPMQEHLEQALGDPRRWTAVVSAFAMTGMALAALGIFGLMSYVVRQRRREFGVRLALGASPRSLGLLVVQGGMRYAGAGTLVGLGLVTFESRWLGALLYRVEATSPVVLLAAVALLLATGLLSCWRPGVRAARIKPLEVISGE